MSLTAGSAAFGGLALAVTVTVGAGLALAVTVAAGLAGAVTVAPGAVTVEVGPTVVIVGLA